MRRLRPILTTWPFLASLALLLLNDFWWKAAHPGLLTGKLSDFAGIALVALLLFALAPRRRGYVFAAIAATFAYWKSPLSQPLIDFANQYLPFAIGRTVDYGDLAALLVMPLCYLIARRPEDFQRSDLAVRRLLVVPVAFVTALALTATSVVPTVQDYEIRPREPAATLEPADIASAIARFANSRDLECKDCSNPAVTASYSGDGLTLSYSFPDSRTVILRIRAYPSGIIFGSSAADRINRLVAALKKQFSRAHKNLEVVERPGTQATDGMQEHPDAI